MFAYTVNGTGALRVRVERDPADSVIARIVKMVEEASETKAPTQLFIEKIEQRYSIGMVIATSPSSRSRSPSAPLSSPPCSAR